MTKLACIALTLVLAAAPAHADAGDTGGDKSEALATSLSIAGSLVGPALIVGASKCCDGPTATTPYARDFLPLVGVGVAAMVFGPSVGDWYAGKWWSHGLELRLAGGGAFAAGAGFLIQGALANDDGGVGLGLALGAAGGAAIIPGTRLPIWDAHSAPPAHNPPRPRT